MWVLRSRVERRARHKTYTQSHMDNAADSLGRIKDRAESVHVYKFAYVPELLRHLTARFALLQVAVHT